MSLIEDQLKIGIEVNLSVEDQSDTKQKWDLAKDKRTDWIKLKKPNGFFLESSENGNNLFIQGTYVLKVMCTKLKVRKYQTKFLWPSIFPKKLKKILP